MTWWWTAHPAAR
ncbi:hypothetical protein FGK60_06600 [Streptomyces sp. DASNCL29]|nr:hypothetical protein FGK60_06600 [Streptomyces sp. DASNCL29]